MRIRNLFAIGATALSGCALAITPAGAGASPGSPLGTWFAAACTYGQFSGAAFGPGSGGVPAMIPIPLTLHGIDLTYWRRLGNASISPGETVWPWVVYDYGQYETSAPGCHLPFSATAYAIPSLPATYESETVAGGHSAFDVDNLYVRIPSTQKVRVAVSGLTGAAVDLTYDGLEKVIASDGTYDLGSLDAGVE